ncbi:hypothetical protein [Pseudomonas sp. RL_15y_Pfl2_60]|uniref:hypothetical protein n=1 Tax=Pseudomonas sp. RL_15y_Pfl2_60 TaxID=3088709 RepID=UPI00403F0BF2
MELDVPPLDPQKRLAARNATLTHEDALNCMVYRPDEQDPDAEEIDLGDAKILFTGLFEAPADWDEQEREEFFGDTNPELFMTAFIECESKPESAQFFTVEGNDYVATMPNPGEVVMFYVLDYSEDDNGREYIVVRDDEPMS